MKTKKTSFRKKKLLGKIESKKETIFLLDENGLYRAELFDSSFNNENSELKGKNGRLFLSKNDGTEYEITNNGIYYKEIEHGEKV